jgi:acetylornithine deacetylase/succinyl-diaminopimelate desuccinylase-like protein
MRPDVGLRSAWLAALPALLMQTALPARSIAADGDLLARDILKELVEIDTTQSARGTTRAAEAVQRRLFDAGFPAGDVQLIGPREDKKNLVVRLRGTGRHPPLLMIGHLDVVEATRSEWATDPFKLVEKDGFLYGRGSVDMKNGDAIMVASLIRMKAAHFKPARDIILALTVDEEDGGDNGVAWLFKNHRELVNAEFALNMDDYSVVASHGVAQFYQLEAAEKIYADYQLVTKNIGGHSSLPVPDNAIYEMADALKRLADYRFPVQLNPVTRAYYGKMADIETGERAADIRAILADPAADPAAYAAAAARLSQNRMDNATLRTTCVATRIHGGDQNNSLPQRAEAVVNCRIVPGDSPEKIRQTLVQVVAARDPGQGPGAGARPAVAVKFVDTDGTIRDTAPDRLALIPPPPNPVIMKPLQTLVQKYWPGISVIPTQAAGASDSVYVNDAGIPAYLVTGFKFDREDDRWHASNERIGIDVFNTGNAFFYEFLTAVTAH